MVLRHAMALEHIIENIDVIIQPDELIVGTAGGPSRHSILFPELRGLWFAEVLEAISDGKSYRIGEAEVQKIKDEVIPYWKGMSSHEYYLSLLPQETEELIYGEGNWDSAGMIQDNANIDETLN